MEGPPPIKPECKQCPVGVASKTDEGRACRFVDRAWAKGAFIYREGDAAEHAWYIKSGTVILRRKTGNNGATNGGQVQALRFVGSFLGVELLVTDHYSDTAIAGCDSVLCGITREGLDHWIGPKHDPARTTLELTLHTQVSELRRRHQSEGSAIQRTASWLCSETPRLEAMALQRRELADLLNMRAETLSRVLARLCSMGAIAMGRTFVQITNVEALRAVAAGEEPPANS